MSISRRVVERVEHREEALARHGEDAVAALDRELVDEDLATGVVSSRAALARPRGGVTRLFPALADALRIVRHVNRILEFDAVDNLPVRIVNFDPLGEVYLSCLDVGGDNRSRLGHGGRSDEVERKFATFRIEEQIRSITQMKIECGDDGSSAGAERIRLSSRRKPNKGRRCAIVSKMAFLNLGLIPIS